MYLVDGFIVGAGWNGSIQACHALEETKDGMSYCVLASMIDDGRQLSAAQSLVWLVAVAFFPVPLDEEELKRACGA